MHYNITEHDLNTSLHQHPKTPKLNSLTVIYTNCCSLENKSTELTALISSHQPDIIALTEIWLGPDVLDSEINLPNFAIFRKDSQRPLSAGACIYISTAITASAIPFNTLDPCQFMDSIWLRVELSKQHTLLLGNIYRSPQCTKEDDSLLCDTISTIIAAHNFTNLLIVGDFNCPNVD